MEKLFLKIRRKPHPEADAFWEYFRVPFAPGMTVGQALEEIQKNPLNADFKAAPPVVWESGCRQGDCGACAMRIDGRVALACTARVTDAGKPVTLEPLSKFPVVRDLCVDRSRMEADFLKVSPWTPINLQDAFPPKQTLNAEQTALSQALARCIQCGACLEACPQYNDRSDFIGAAAIARAREAHLHPSGSKSPRLEALMDQGGVDDCGNAQNCQQVCPTQVPLITSIARMGREVTKQAIRDLFGKE